jgi:glutamyl-tRNA reductase
LNAVQPETGSQHIVRDTYTEVLDNIKVIGADHKTVDLETLGLASRRQDELYSALYPLSEGVVVLSTCNRVEVYLDNPSLDEVVEEFKRITGITPRIMHGIDAIKHLFRVASGIESKVLGENEILGQVREAWVYAKEKNYTSKTLDLVFMHALKTGRRAREETGISEGVIGYPKAAVIAATRKMGGLEGRNILVLGAGKAGRIIVEEACKHNPRIIYVANRNLAKAFSVSGICSLVKPISMGEVVGNNYDVAFIAVSDFQDTWILSSIVRNSSLIVDISTPPIVRGEKVVDYKYLNDIVNEGMDNRRKWIPRVEDLIDEETVKLIKRIRARNSDSAVLALNMAIENVLREEMQWINGKIPGEYRKQVELAIKASLKKLAHPLIRSLRQFAESGLDEPIIIIQDNYLKSLDHGFRGDEP